MKKKKLLIVIGALLVVSIGSTMAYFISKVVTNGNGAEVNATTATIKSSELKVVGALNFNDTGILPGHKNISSVSVTATGNNELIVYNLIWNGTNTLNTPLNYTVYKTSSSIETSSSCNQKKKVINGSIQYNEECSIANIGELGEPISNGIINKEETKAILVKDEFITSVTGGITVYYYVVLEYPNLEGNQNNDIGGSFSGKVTVEESNTDPDINILAIKIEQEDGTYKEVKDIPSSGYALNEAKSTCSNGAIPTWKDNGLFISNLTKSGTSCYLSFDKGKTLNEILATYTVDTSRSNGEFTGIFTEDTNGKIFEGPADDYGTTTYFFAGSNPNNWVKFAGYYWRIIRINGDGTLRLIYNGKTTDQTGESTQLGTSAFNEQYNDNAYVGYMYGTPNSDNYNDTHANTNSSTIKNVLDIWYASNIGDNAAYSGKIATNVGFCGDRTTVDQVWSGYGNLGYKMELTGYGPVSRVVANGNWRTTQLPSLKCPNVGHDLYTLNTASTGNKVLSKPIGLLTSDEVVYAGGFGGTANSNYWLYTGQNYWTMSPYGFLYNVGIYYATVFCVNSDGALSGAHVYWTVPGVRPVINLKADTLITGSGTISDPFVVTS